VQKGIGNAKYVSGQKKIRKNLGGGQIQSNENSGYDGQEKKSVVYGRDFVRTKGRPRTKALSREKRARDRDRGGDLQNTRSQRGGELWIVTEEKKNIQCAGTLKVGKKKQTKSD